MLFAFDEEGLSEMRYSFKKKRNYPWGDYGAILTHGLAKRDEDGILHLARCGPYSPPIFFPFGCIVLDHATRVAMEHSSLTGYRFKHVEKSLIVNLNWESWDLSAEKPLFYPSEGEPANFLFDSRHCEETSRLMGDFWELSADSFGKVSTIDDESIWTSEAEPTVDFIQPNEEWRLITVSEDARQFLIEVSKDSIEFRLDETLSIGPN